MGKKIIIGFMKDHKFSYIIGILFMLLSSYIQTLFPKVLGNTVDVLKTNGFQPNAVYVNIAYILLIAAGTFVCTYAWRNLVIGKGRVLECFLKGKTFRPVSKALSRILQPQENRRLDRLCHQ